MRDAVTIGGRKVRYELFDEKLTLNIIHSAILKLVAGLPHVSRYLHYRPDEIE
jgi:hypothetical protein